MLDGLDDVAAVEAALAAMAPPEVSTGALAVADDDVARLHPAELVLVAAAVDKRRREFASGRRLLRTLIEREGVRCEGPMARLASGAPALPPGVVGSLAHDAGIAVGAVSRHPDVRAIGIDVEPATQLDLAMERLILRADEGVDAHLAFTLKEAVYKAWSSLGGEILDHHDVKLAVRQDGRFEGAVLARRATFGGRYVLAGRRWVALVIVGSPDHRLWPLSGRQ